MADLKYVAAGFLHDAERLLRDFIRENSMEFSVFAEVWKKHNFSLIYLGRPNGKELREFTLEIFQLSMTNFLESGSLLYQVGGTFLLYALYRNQIMSPPMKIRITLSQFKTILALLEMSRAENYRSLHYVLSYLAENSFDFVACPKLKGPTSIRNEVYKDNDENPTKIQESDIKYELTEIVETNVLPEIDDLFTQYEKTVHSLNSPLVDMTSKHPSFKEFAFQIDELLNEGKISDRGTGTNPKNRAIGSRRALIKAAAFSNPVLHYLSHDENNATTSCVSDGVESVGEEEPSKLPDPTPVVRKKRHFRRGRRKVGRPKKLPADRVLSEEEEPPNPSKSIEVKGRCRRSRGPQFTRIRHYYAEDFEDSDDMVDMPSSSNYLPKGECFFSSDSSYQPSS